MLKTLMQRVVLGSALNAQQIKVYRSEGSFIKGKWTEIPQTPAYIIIKGIVYPSTEKELHQLPEGDRITAAITFLTTVKLYTTHAEISPKVSGTSDRLEWNEEKYKIINLLPWKDYGFYASMAISELGG
jgi:hypothetical protein